MMIAFTGALDKSSLVVVKKALPGHRLLVINNGLTSRYGLCSNLLGPDVWRHFIARLNTTKSTAVNKLVSSINESFLVLKCSILPTGV